MFSPYKEDASSRINQVVQVTKQLVANLAPSSRPTLHIVESAITPALQENLVSKESVRPPQPHAQRPHKSCATIPVWMSQRTRNIAVIVESPVAQINAACRVLASALPVPSTVKGAVSLSNMTRNTVVDVDRFVVHHSDVQKANVSTPAQRVSQQTVKGAASTHKQTDNIVVPVGCRVDRICSVSRGHASVLLVNSTVTESVFIHYTMVDIAAPAQRLAIKGNHVH